MRSRLVTISGSVAHGEFASSEWLGQEEDQTGAESNGDGRPGIIAHELLHCCTSYPLQLHAIPLTAAAIRIDLHPVELRSVELYLVADDIRRGW